jgi:hypothetical protein
MTHTNVLLEFRKPTKQRLVGKNTITQALIYYIKKHLRNHLLFGSLNFNNQRLDFYGLIITLNCVQFENFLKETFHPVVHRFLI